MADELPLDRSRLRRAGTRNTLYRSRKRQKRVYERHTVRFYGNTGDANCEPRVSVSIILLASERLRKLDKDECITDPFSSRANTIIRLLANSILS